MTKYKIYLYLLLNISSMCYASHSSTQQSLLTLEIDKARKLNNGCLPRQKYMAPKLLPIPQTSLKYDQIPASSLDNILNEKALKQAVLEKALKQAAQAFSDEFLERNEREHNKAMKSNIYKSSIKA